MSNQWTGTSPNRTVNKQNNGFARAFYCIHLVPSLSHAMPNKNIKWPPFVFCRTWTPTTNFQRSCLELNCTLTCSAWARFYTDRLSSRLNRLWYLYTSRRNNINSIPIFTRCPQSRSFNSLSSLFLQRGRIHLTWRRKERRLVNSFFFLSFHFPLSFAVFPSDLTWSDAAFYSLFYMF